MPNQAFFRTSNPWLLGIVLDVVLPANVSVTEEVYSLKVAVWQSADSFGYVKIMGKLKELPKIRERGQLILVRGSRGMVRTEYKEEKVAVLPPQFKDYREVLLANFPHWEKDNVVVADQYSVMGSKKTPLCVDGQMKDLVEEMRAEFKLYEERKGTEDGYCFVDPKKYFTKSTCAEMIEFRCPDKTKNYELNLALVVAVWKSERFGYALELNDLSCYNVEKRRLPFRFAEEYKLVKAVDFYDDRVPCAFVRIPTDKKWHKSFYFDPDEGWLEPGCLVNLKSLNVQKAIVSLVETESSRKAGFQGFNYHADDGFNTKNHIIDYKAKIRRIELREERKRRLQGKENAEKTVPKNFKNSA